MKILKFAALITCLLLIFSGGVFAQEDQGIKFTVLGGLDLFGNVTAENDDLDVDDDEDANIGVLFGAEAAMMLSENFYAGLGLRYQLPRELDVDDSDAFNFVPIYVLLQYNFGNQGSIIPFVVGHIGYNFFIAETDALEDLADTYLTDASVGTEGGLYWGIGGGVYVTENVSIQALYNINYGAYTVEADEGDYDLDVIYSKLTISAAYTF